LEEKKMKKVLLVFLAIITLAGVGFTSATNDPYTLQVKKLYSAPDENSNLILSIPINVQLLDISPDANWYKVQISYSLGPIGYTYVGWARVPVGEALAARLDKLAKAPPQIPEASETESAE
jgi:hypothetical protein